MTYHVLVQFDIASDKRDAFKRAAHLDAETSLADEPGTLRFDVLQDEHNLDRFYLDEVYESEMAFKEHCSNEPFQRFFAEIGEYAVGPVFLFKGHRVSI